MSNHTPVQPQLADLFASYLEKQADAHEQGVVSLEPEVTPYDAGPVQPVDAKLAWDEARVALSLLGIRTTKAPQAPTGWSMLVSQHEPAVAIAFAAGNFPQLVRNFHVILQKPDLSQFRPNGGRPVAASGLTEWAESAANNKDTAKMLLALGAFRLAKQFDLAERYLRDHTDSIPEQHLPAWENERAALLWHQGNAQAACEIWNQLPPSAPVLFNRGMADLFANRPVSARENLDAAIRMLPENSAWQFLARLYLTMSRAER